MLISEFARRAALSVDTVRYYVRAGLMSPQQGSKGGRNPYQEFSEADVRVAEVIRFGQALGMSLKEITAVLHAGEDSQLEILKQRRDDLRLRGEEMLRLSRYLEQKIEWITAGSQGNPPALEHPSLNNSSLEACK